MTDEATRKDIEEFLSWKNAQSTNTGVSLPEEEVEELRKSLSLIRQAKQDLGRLVARFEQQKSQILELINRSQENVDEKISGLRQKHDFPEDADIQVNEQGATVTW